MSRPIAFLLGSDSDLPTIEKALATLDELEVGYHVRILSAHRTPEDACGFARDAKDNGVQVLIGVAGMASAGLSDVLRARAAFAAQAGVRKETSVILIWLDGGPGHMDLYDLKPEAPAEYRGLWKPIKTNVPGFEISEMFPKQARVADKFSIVRSRSPAGSAVCTMIAT